MQFIHELYELLIATFFDILPIAVIIFGFQFLIIRKRVKNLKAVLTGMVYVLIGITFFLLGL
jgi:arginine exporter protein ArgO